MIFSEGPNKGWGKWVAWNPVAELSLSLEDDSYDLIRFVKKHKDLFLAGFLSYEAGMKQLGVMSKHSGGTIPAIHFRAYDQFGSFEVSTTALICERDHYGIGAFEPQITAKEYAQNFQKIIAHIRSGNFYQLNYTHALKGETTRPPREVFNALLNDNIVSLAAYFEDQHWAIHSLSPERFIKVKNGVIKTEPIKGTRPRGVGKEDERLVKELLESEKEQAELYMIIDLLRNDLGKVCETGSVKVLEAKSVRRLSKVMHTYGVIEGRIKADIHPIEALLSMCPGGSISGCPKKRAVEIINELENYQRGVYTGTVGFIHPDGTMDFNIAIRTVVQEGNVLTLGVGGGITIDSNETEEYEETLAKAASFQP